jgi:hypothetical protein
MAPAPTILRSLEYLRNRLRDMVNGDTSVDIGVLLQGLNTDIGMLGGSKVELRSHEIRSRFFSETDPPID